MKQLINNKLYESNYLILAIIPKIKYNDEDKTEFGIILKNDKYEIIEIREFEDGLSKYSRNN